MKAIRALLAFFLIKKLLDIIIGNPSMLKYQKRFNPFYYNSNVQQIKESDFKKPDIPEVKDGLTRLKSFVESDGLKRIALFFCPVPFDNDNGQRSVRFAQEFALRGYKVIYVVCLPNHLPEYACIMGENIFQIPFNWFFPSYKRIIAEEIFVSCKKVLVNFMPFYQAVGIINFVKEKKWITVYDIIDDWEEFYKDGFWPRYDKKTEEYIIADSHVVAAINNSIRNKFSYLRESLVIPNGYSPAILKKELYKPIPKHKNHKEYLTIGTFGFLNGFRFNWELLIKTARKNKNWKFEIIGYGEPAFLHLPDNVYLIGRVAPHELYKYARYWDLAIVPYHNNSLCKKLNPIKIFEFLYFDLPVVVFGCTDAKDFPYTYYTESPEDFINKIKIASNTKISYTELSEFLQDKTWENRTIKLLGEIKKVESSVLLYNEYI